MFLVGSKGKYIDLGNTNFLLNKNSEESFIHNLNSIKESELVTQRTMQVT